MEEPTYHLKQLEVYISLTQSFFFCLFVLNLTNNIIFLLIIYSMNSFNALSPIPIHAKFGWYNQFLKLNSLLSNRKSKMLIIGYSLFSNLLRYLELWRKYFIYHRTLNFGTINAQKDEKWSPPLRNSLNFNIEINVFVFRNLNQLDWKMATLSTMHSLTMIMFTFMWTGNE